MIITEKNTKASVFKKWNSLRAKEARLAWILILPTAVIVFGLVIFPAIFSVWISFHDIGLDNLNDVFNADFVGLENYKGVIDDYAFKFQGLNSWGAAVTSIVYAFAGTSLAIIFGLIAALLLNRPFRGRGVARAVFLFPYVAPIVSIAFVWRWILDPLPSGVLNDILMKLGVIDLPVAFLATRGLALFIVILIDSWRYFPFAMLLILARLQAIPRDLHEAAAVDGASRFQQFLNITLPELRYVLGVLFLLRFVWTFNKFDDVFLLTSGAGNTKVLPILTYRYAVGTGQLGVGAACAMFLFVVLVVFILVYHLRVLKWEK